jgi:O-antigen ligase
VTPDVSSVARESKPTPGQLLPTIFAGLFGALLGLSLLKFGNPVVLDKYVVVPNGFWETVLNPWPLAWGFWLLGAVAVIGLLVAHRPSGLPRALVVLPLAWLVWEAIAGTQTVDAALTRATLRHFASCVVCFYLGLFALGRVRRLGWFWAGLIAGFTLVLVSGFFQHFGGLAATRRDFLLYSDPAGVPPEFLARLNSNRIFGTLFYANTLAGAILMLLPATLGVVVSRQTRLTTAARCFVLAVAAGSALACLYWSGSKGGWLLMLLLGLLAGLQLPVGRQVKLMLVGTALMLGLAAFVVRNAGYFEKGASSVVARYDFWRAAVQTTREHPLFGTGPGTFAKAYAKVKQPGSEMTRLAHNDYLEQASDSGIPGFLLYAIFVIGGLAWTFRPKPGGDPVKLGVQLGLLGWALHSFMEFHLYLPAMAWPAFALLGWLLGGRSNPWTAATSPATMQVA